jgi:hypothetical protein
MSIRSITLTGVQESTDLDRVRDMTRVAQGISVEWGVLYSPERAGGGGRYPSFAWILAFSQYATDNNLRIALHVCGKGVDNLLANDAETVSLATKFNRVQLNFNQAERSFDVRRIGAAIRMLQRPVITQHNEWNRALAHMITDPNHQLLVDSSLGRGMSPTSWPAPIALKSTGYAGGLGPRNLSGALDQIEVVTGNRSHLSWVDLESSLFTPEGRFDPDRAEEAINVLQQREANRTAQLMSSEMPVSP